MYRIINNNLPLQFLCHAEQMALSSRATATQIWASNAGAREVRRLPVPSLRRHRARREPLRGAMQAARSIIILITRDIVFGLIHGLMPPLIFCYLRSSIT